MLGYDAADAGNPGTSVPDSETMVGTWYVYVSDWGGITLVASMEFNSDGTYVIRGTDSTATTTWFETGIWDLSPDASILTLVLTSSSDPGAVPGETASFPVVLLPDGRMVLNLETLLQRVP